MGEQEKAEDHKKETGSHVLQVLVQFACDSTDSKQPNYL